MARNVAFHLRDENEPRTGAWRKRGQLGADIMAPTDGRWIEVGGYFPLTVTIEGENFEGHAELCVSNAERRPLDSEHGALLGPPLTRGREVQYITTPFMWVKFRVVSLANGPIVEVNLYGGPATT
jgi:hypothetical protein